MSAPIDPLAAGSASNAGVLLDVPRVQGVDPVDTAGTLPDDAKQNGIVCIIPRWPAFPTDARIDEVEIFIVGNPNSIAQRNYGAADDAAEFLIPIGPTLLPDLPTFEIMYTVRSVNITTSPPRRLTFAIVAPPQVLKEATFPDANLWGYINCTKNNPQNPDSLYVWEGIRILVPFDNRFQLLDVIELVWQGWDSLNGSGTALTPAVTFTGTVTDITNKQPISIVIQPFVPHIEPMRDNDSATTSYLLLRNGVPMFSSFTGLVKIDRVIPGNSGFCSDANWMK
ncbi:hypothetical protein J3D54_004524 [Pseudomonas sp. GGS8]|uniref:hypothetical protein n=1 Tax=Pseudomonas sp. GGS8 TaxID=2817892 RepID=UPI00209DFCF4|nr:hypothetical protein [Pseudomonas sp. GGS8]MCP1445392.1 hypothetical protein [Pseudomonas sp. GGS8]